MKLTNNLGVINTNVYCAAFILKVAIPTAWKLFSLDSMKPRAAVVPDLQDDAIIYPTGLVTCFVSRLLASLPPENIPCQIVERSI